MAVHVACLQAWRAMAPNPTRCESCHFVYRTERERLATIIAHPATCVVFTSLIVAGGLFACAEGYRLARKIPKPADTRTYARQSLSRMWRAAEFLSASFSVLLRRRSLLRDSDLIAAMHTGEYASNLQQNDAIVETILTGGLVVVTLYKTLVGKVQQWLATKAEQVLPYDARQDHPELEPPPPAAAAPPAEEEELGEFVFEDEEDDF